MTLPEVERFVTIDSSFKDLIFNEKFSLGQFNVKDYGWPHSNQASMDESTGLGLRIFTMYHRLLMIMN